MLRFFAVGFLGIVVAVADLLQRRHAVLRLPATEVRSYAEIYPRLGTGVLLHEPPSDWAADWAAADPDTFGVKVCG